MVITIRAGVGVVAMVHLTGSSAKCITDLLFCLTMRGGCRILLGVVATLVACLMRIPTFLVPVLVAI
jgi:hypothetical protein